MAPPRFRYHTNQLGFKRRVLLRRPPKPQPSLCDDASDKTGVTRDSGTAERRPKKPRTRVYASTIVCSWRTGCSYDPYGRAHSMSLGPNKAIARALDGPRRGVQFQRREPRIRAPSMLSIQSTDVLCVIRILYALYTYSTRTLYVLIGPGRGSFGSFAPSQPRGCWPDFEKGTLSRLSFHGGPQYLIHYSIR